MVIRRLPRRGLLASLALLLLAGALASAAPITVEITGGNPLDGPFLGFGAEWDCHSYAQAGIDDADLALIRSRLAWMRMPMVRIGMEAHWCYLGGDRYDWDTPDMRALCRNLDLCEQLGISVVLNEWGCEPKWLKTPDISLVNDPKYAEVIGAYLDHLLNVKKYHCINYFVFGNEPNIEVKDFPRWLQGATQVAAELKKRGLDHRLTFLGPDATVAPMWPIAHTEVWMKPTLAGASSFLGGYDLHHYAALSEIEDQGIRNFLGDAWKMVRQGDADRSKPLLMTEIGYWVENPDPAKSSNALNNPIGDDWRFGLQMAQYASQSVAAGSWGTLAWMLDDTSHAGFTNGMWRDKKEGFAPRPWFYVWALLSRSFPPGSTFALVEPPLPSVQMLAARVPTGAAKTGWSFAIANAGKEAVLLRLRVPGGSNAALTRYLYGEKDRLAGADGLPLPIDRVAARDGAGWEIACPPESVTVLAP